MRLGVRKGPLGPKLLGWQVGDNEIVQELVMLNGLLESYRLQARSLLDSGADLLLIETVFDALNVKTVVCAYPEMCITKRRRYVVVASASISGTSSRTLSELQ
ncbi:MAG: homocysteine S-methyltransferase family protein [Candidatus Hodgkinia cicadicola]